MPISWIKGCGICLPCGCLFVCGEVVGGLGKKRKSKGGRWEGGGFREDCGIILPLFIYSLPGVSLLFIVGSLGRNKGGMVQSYFQGFHLFPGCLCVSVGIESLRNLPVV